MFANSKHQANIRQTCKDLEWPAPRRGDLLARLLRHHGGEHLEQYAAVRPPVDPAVVAALEDELGRKELGRAAHSIRDVVARQVLAQAHVCELQVAVVHDQAILRLHRAGGRARAMVTVRAGARVRAQKQSSP